MDFSNFSAVFTWIIAHGYWLLLAGMLIEGPTVTMAAGMAASLHYFNPFYIFLLSIFGDLGPDALFYVIGFLGRLALIEKFDIRLGLSKERLKKLEALAADHLYKIVAAIKFTPFLPVPGFMAIGATHASFKKFMAVSFVITSIRSVIFLAIGYFFGKSYETFSAHAARKDLLIFAIFILIIIISIVYKKIVNRFGGKIEKI